MMELFSGSGDGTGLNPRPAAWQWVLCSGLALVVMLVAALHPATPWPSPSELYRSAWTGHQGIRSASLPGRAVFPAATAAMPSGSSAPRRTLPIASATARPPLALRATDGSPTLYDMPVSNHGARVRLIIYWKGLEDQITIKSPMEVGGLKSPEYLAISPQGKMPVLTLPGGAALPESEVISQFLLDSYPDVGPRLSGGTPLERAHVRLLTRFHDLYLAPVQAAMYRAMGAEERRAGLQQIHQQLQILEGRAKAPYLAGPEPTSADAAIFPTAVFLDFILPRHFGWTSAFDGCPRLAQWFEFMSKDPQGTRVRAEIEGGLNGWEASKRWDTLGITAQVQSSGLKFSPPFA